jgi:hypothetical protein
LKYVLLLVLHCCCAFLTKMNAIIEV